MQVSAPWPDDVKLGEVIWGQMGLKFKDLLEHCESTILTVKRAISDFFIRKKVSNSDIYFTFCFPRIFYSQIQQGERSLWYLEMRENIFFRSFWGPFLTWIVKMFKTQRSRFSEIGGGSMTLVDNLSIHLGKFTTSQNWINPPKIVSLRLKN